MDMIIPKITGYRIMTPDCKTVISEHGPSELNHCRKLIESHHDLGSHNRPIGNVLQYVFEKDESDVA